MTLLSIVFSIVIKWVTWKSYFTFKPWIVSLCLVRWSVHFLVHLLMCIIGISTSPCRTPGLIRRMDPPCHGANSLSIPFCRPLKLINSWLPQFNFYIDTVFCGPHGHRKLYQCRNWIGVGVSRWKWICLISIIRVAVGGVGAHKRVYCSVFGGIKGPRLGLSWGRGVGLDRHSRDTTGKELTFIGEKYL